MFIMPTNQLSSTRNCFRYVVRQKVGTYVHLIFTLERTRQDVCKLHKFWIQAVQQQNLLWALWIQYTFWTKGTACTWTTFIQVQNFMRNFSSIPYMPVVQCAKIGRACQKTVTTTKLKKTEAVFRHNEPLLAIKWCDKRAVTVLTTIHATINVATKQN